MNDATEVYIEQHKGGLMALVDFEGNERQTGFYSFTNITRYARENGMRIMRKPEEESDD